MITSQSGNLNQTQNDKNSKKLNFQINNTSTLTLTSTLTSTSTSTSTLTTNKSLKLEKKGSSQNKNNSTLKQQVNNNNNNNNSNPNNERGKKTTLPKITRSSVEIDPSRKQYIIVSEGSDQDDVEIDGKSYRDENQLQYNENQQQQLKPQSPNDSTICAHLYQNAYLKGIYSDLTIRLSRQAKRNATSLDGIVFNLHRIIAIRSPYLLRLINQVEGGELLPAISITMNVKDCNLSSKGLGIGFGHLYASYSTLFLTGESSLSPTERTVLLRSVLAAARLLELEDLEKTCTDFMVQEISLSSAVEMACYLSQSEADNPDNNMGVFMQDLKDAVFTYLCNGFLENIMEAHGLIWGNLQSTAGIFAAKAFAKLPFEWVKSIIESEFFNVPSNLDRFQFAKQVIAFRTSQEGIMQGSENVLLTFGSQLKHGVAVIRKQLNNKPGRKLWREAMTNYRI